MFRNFRLKLKHLRIDLYFMTTNIEIFANFSQARRWLHRPKAGSVKFFRDDVDGK